MRERDIHNLIEQQETEKKQRIWEKVCAQVDMTPTQPIKTAPRKRTVKWALIAMAIVCVATLSIVLPLTLRDNEPSVRFCDVTQYTVEELSKPLKEYIAENNYKFLYVDWYENADEVITKCGYNKSDRNDIFFFTENIINSDTGENLLFSVTDNKTRVDVFENYYDDYQLISVQGIEVNYIGERLRSRATFEYNNYNYYLEIDVGEAQERLTEIIQDMLK